MSDGFGCFVEFAQSWCGGPRDAGGPLPSVARAAATRISATRPDGAVGRFVAQLAAAAGVEVRPS